MLVITAGWLTGCFTLHSWTGPLGVPICPSLPSCSIHSSVALRNQSTCSWFLWAGGQTDPLLRLCRTLSSRSSALVILTSVAGNRNERLRGSIMSVSEIQDQKAIGREMLVQQADHANADVSASPLRVATICSSKSKRDYTLELTAD